MADLPPSTCRPARKRRRALRPLAVDARRLAKLLCLGLRTVRSMDAAGRLPAAVRLNARKVWIVTEIRRWLAAGCPDRETWDVMKNATR
jgi:predicted DNA-binding transcriptional regulator AlpA